MVVFKKFRVIFFKDWSNFPSFKLKCIPFIIDEQAMFNEVQAIIYFKVQAIYFEVHAIFYRSIGHLLMKYRPFFIEV